MGRFPRDGRGHRGGRGRGRFSNQAKKTNQNKVKKSINDHVFYIGNADYANEFDKNMKFITNFVMRTFEDGVDVADMLKYNQSPDTTQWMPTLKSVKTKDDAGNDRDKDEVDNEKRQYELEFKLDRSEAQKRVKQFKDNVIKLYALLWDRCSKGMQQKIEARKNFESEIYQNPLKLKEAILHHSANYQENRYEMSIIYDSWRNLFTAKQKDDEGLIEFRQRLKNMRDIAKSHLGGPMIITKIIKKSTKYKDGMSEEDRDALQEEVFDQLMAYILLANSDQDKYGSLLKRLKMDKALKKDNFPKTMDTAVEALNDHAFDPAYREKMKSKRDKDKRKKTTENKDEDGEDDGPPHNFQQNQIRCYKCGVTGHKSDVCDKDIPREKWWINTNGSSNAQKKEEVKEKPEKGQVHFESEASTGWCGAHIIDHALQFYQENELRWFILLDTGSTHNVFCNDAYASDQRDAKGHLNLTTNAGTLTCNKWVDLPMMPKVQECWFSEKAVTNVLSFHEIAKIYKTSYDGEKDEFTVKVNEKTSIVFMPKRGGLYIWKPTVKDHSFLEANIKCDDLCFVETVMENKTFYTEQQVRRAKKAKEFYLAMGSATVKDLLALMRMNLVKDCEITLDDVKLMEKIFGPDVSGIKGKTTRKTPKAVTKDMIHIPKELVQQQRMVTLDIDGITVNGLKFLTTISRNIIYRSAHYCKKNEMQECYDKAIQTLIALYNKGGFVVTEIHCDNEFRPLMHPLEQKYGVHFNFANPNEHVPRVERNNRTIKERVRVTYHALPFKRFPKLLTCAMVTESTKKLNFFPAKKGISKYYSPRMIVHHENLEYEKHGKHSVGQYVLGHEEPTITNTNAPRALDCIYLGYNSNQQGGHILLHLQTNKKVIRRNVTPAPITPAIVRQVEHIAKSENMPEGLKIQNRYNETLFDAAWIPGVDYDADEFEEYHEDIDYSTDEEDEENEEDDYEYDRIDEQELADLREDIDENEIDDNDNNNDNEDDNEDDNNNNNNDNDDDNNDDDDDNGDDDIDENENFEEINEEEAEDREEENDEVESVEEQEGSNPDEAIEIEEEEPTIRRSERDRRAPERLIQTIQFNQADPDNPVNKGELEYSVQSARVIAYLMTDNHEMSYTFAQTYSLKKGIKKFGERGENAASKEIKQLHDRKVFDPIDYDELTVKEKKQAMESLIFLVEKRDGSIKARACANGSTQRDYIEREDAASPTASTDAIIITSVIDAKQKRDVMIADVPNAFVQTDVMKKYLKRGDRIIMKIRGILVEYLCAFAYEKYAKFVRRDKKGEKVLYVMMLKALYGMLIASLLYYKKFVRDIQSIGFELNPYDPCVANRMVGGKQHTITFHVDDIKSSHVDPKVNDKFKEWLSKMYSQDGIGEVKVTRGERHDYLAMMLDFSEEGKLKIDQVEYVKAMCESFPEKLKNVSSPWTEKLFDVTESEQLNTEKSSTFHTYVMKIMFVAKRARQDVLPGVAFLATRTRGSTAQDWSKLVRLLSWMNKTCNDATTLEADDKNEEYWHVDAAFAVHNDMKSHTGGTFTLGKGVITSVSTKQKVNSRSSTEAELIGMDDVVDKIVWAHEFIGAQGFKSKTIVNRDNTSSMKLEMNGKASSGKRTRHFNIRYFYVTDLIKRDIMSIKYCPTEDMMADYMTKPLVGFKLHYFRAWIMNLPQYPELASRSVLANRRQKPRIEVVEETLTTTELSTTKMPDEGQTKIKMPDENQVRIKNTTAGSRKSVKKTVASRKREPKTMTYLDALKKPKTVLGHYDQNTIRSRIRMPG